ncbi:hypothetical protein G7054_g11280 [Neopestalotiopsis clavispora]|nr:hypothetical protein G7054_g11280 [Neopestalotiopsis clavispora]
MVMRTNIVVAQSPKKSSKHLAETHPVTPEKKSSQKTSTGKTDGASSAAQTHDDDTSVYNEDRKHGTRHERSKYSGEIESDSDAEFVLEEEDDNYADDEESDILQFEVLYAEVVDNECGLDDKPDGETEDPIMVAADDLGNDGTSSSDEPIVPMIDNIFEVPDAGSLSNGVIKIVVPGTDQRAALETQVYAVFATSAQGAYLRVKQHLISANPSMTKVKRKTNETIFPTASLTMHSGTKWSAPAMWYSGRFRVAYASRELAENAGMKLTVMFDAMAATNTLATILMYGLMSRNPGPAEPGLSAVGYAQPLK